MKRPILYIVIPFCLGIAISKFVAIPIAYLLILSAVFIALAILKSHRNFFSHITLYLAVFFFGMACYRNSLILPADHISRFIQDEPQKVIVSGVVEDDPITGPALYGKKRTSFTLRVKELGKKRDSPNQPGIGTFGTVPLFPVSGFAQVSAYSDKGISVSFGDELMLEGYLSKVSGLKNPGVFDYSEYLAIKGIYAVLRVKDNSLVKIASRPSGARNDYYHALKKTAYAARHWIRDVFDRYFDEPYRGFTKAIFIGERNYLSKELTEDFVKTGTVHILAISGLNVAIIAGIILYVFWILRIPRKTALALACVFLAVYVFTAGASPPIIRAVIIFFIFALGYLANKNSDMLNSLSIAAMFMLIWNPKELFDPSFQLSFLSIAAIVVFTPKIEAFFHKLDPNTTYSAARCYKYLIKGVSVSIAAWLGTWPFIAKYFNIISPISVAANLIIIPLLSAVMAVSMLFLASAAFPFWWTYLFAGGASIIQQALIYTNGIFSHVPFAYFRIAAPRLEFALLYYALVFTLIMPKYIILGKRRIYRKTVILLILLSLNILAWTELCVSKKDCLKITFLDVGQGDAALVELPKGRVVLIDGGPGGEDGMFDAGRSVVAPVLWNKGIRVLDAIIVSHFHEDHIGGLLYILNNFKVGCVIDSGAIVQESRIYNEYMSAVKRLRIRRITAGRGDMIGPFNGAKFFVLNPDGDERPCDSNDTSLVLKLVYKNFSALFCGDITAPAMKELLSRGEIVKSDIMKLPHHGGNLGDEIIVRDFFYRVNPRVVVISAGRSGRYNAPANRTMNIITQLNSICYVTKRDGAVLIDVNGSSQNINAYK